MNDTIKDWVFQNLANPIAANGGIFIISALSLTMALVAQYAFGLEPCVLCIYQRWPFAISALLGIAGLATLYKEEWSPLSAITVFLAAISFFVGGLIAAYHVGVEQHWWQSALEGCAVTFDSGSIEDLRNLLDNKPAVRCDEVAWSMFGISMAGYNVLMSLGLAIGCTMSAILIRRKQNGLL